jgi:hypothetical protein
VEGGVVAVRVRLSSLLGFDHRNLCAVQPAAMLDEPVY